MEFLWYSLSGLAGGVLGGMGMGGGTILIPLLTIIFSINQHTAQAINLVSFLPMSIVSLIIHLKNKLVDFKDVLFIIIPGILSCVLGCYISRLIRGELLRRFFGGFLIALSIFQLTEVVIKIVKSKRKSKKSC